VDIDIGKASCEQAGDPNNLNCYKTVFDEICYLLLCANEAPCGPLE
jgi:hypothetical protein